MLGLTGGKGAGPVPSRTGLLNEEIAVRRQGRGRTSDVWGGMWRVAEMAVCEHGQEGRAGYRHEALLYGSDDDLLAGSVPFLRAGLDRGSPTVLCIEERVRGLIVDALGDAAGLMVVAEDLSSSPMGAVRARRRLIGELLQRHDAGEVRMLGAVPQDPWEGWVRYEAAVNHVLGMLPVWGLCPYDVRQTSDDVLADVQRTHPWLSGEEAARTVDYQEPAAFLDEQAERDRDPLQSCPPVVEMVDPAPEELAIVEDLAQRTLLGRDDVDAVRLSAMEIVRNAYAHGRPPVGVRIWVAVDRLIVEVSDRGSGLRDPFIGLTPLGAEAVHGLERVYDAVSRVVALVADGRFAVRLTQQATG